MSGFIPWLESLSKQDTRVRAVLRRSLAFEPGQHIDAFPYVEPFLKGEGGHWRRTAHYLVAGLWAAHGSGTSKVSGAQRVSLGKACALHQIRTKATNTEARLLAVLDADADQLPHRLRQLVALLKEQQLDYDGLLKGLQYWNDDQRRTQTAWARDYYRELG